MLNVQEFLDASFAVLNSQDGKGDGDPILFMEKWVPEVVNEINDLRNKAVLQETRILELENDLEAMGG